MKDPIDILLDWARTQRIVTEHKRKVLKDYWEIILKKDYK
jgi:hypothetical protein